MKHYFSLFIMLCLFAGCGVVKKSATSTSAEVNTSLDQHQETSISSYVDTTKIDGKAVSVVKIEFYPDGPDPVIEKKDPSDTMKTADPPAQVSRSVNTIETPGTRITGKIKTAEIVEIQSETTSKGVTEKTAEIEETVAETTEINTTSAAEETPQKDPRRFLWLAILIGVGLVALLVVYYKFIKPLGLGGKATSFIAKLVSFLKKH